jgi:hypothetical protein
MNWLRNHRLAISIALIAIPVEALALHFLPYAPQVGIPRDPDPALRLWGSLSALYHAPALLLNEFACRRIHVPASILCADLMASGYALSVLILRLAWLMIRSR